MADPREPYVRNWHYVDFDVPAAEAAVSAIDTAIQALSNNRFERRAYKPDENDWAGRHFDNFRVEWDNQRGEYDRLIDDLFEQRARISNAITAAQDEIAYRRQQWDQWDAWWVSNGQHQGVARRYPTNPLILRRPGPH